MTLENLVQINQLKREVPEKRNLDLYQGQFEVDNQLFSELIEITQALQSIAQRIEFK